MDTESPLSLDELGRLVEEVARDHRVDARVVGIIPTEGDGSYTEVLMTRGGERSALSIGLRRVDGVGDLRREIAARLTAQR